MKNCLARPLLGGACFSGSLSSFGLHRVGVPRSIHESPPHVKLIFQKFCIFLQQFFKNIEKSKFSKITFCHFSLYPPNSLHFSVPPLPCKAFFYAICVKCPLTPSPRVAPFAVRCARACKNKCSKAHYFLAFPLLLSRMLMVSSTFPSISAISRRRTPCEGELDLVLIPI